MSKRIIVCGGGASGFFAAINIAEKHPDYEVTLLEKSSQILSKVKVSGGGRCNVTNARTQASELVKFYPRGEKKLQPLFKAFSTTDMVDWLAEKGVKTHTEVDLRMFPISNSSQTIIDCFLEAARASGVHLKKNCGISAFYPLANSWKVLTQDGNELEADALVMATGAAPSVWKKLEELGLHMESAVPSLFTFNIKDLRLEGLSGMSFQEVNVRVTSTKLEEQGPLLITHWGLSGPAVLKLSAWGARWLEEQKYHFSIQVNFLPELNFEQFRQQLLQFKAEHPTRKVKNFHLEEVPNRYWERLLAYLEINPEIPFGELPNKLLNKLTVELTQATFEVRGKSTFKEEFVTCGGVALSEVNLKTMESKRFPGLYFSGEVLDIDALTGGFNFQACWTTAWLISEAI
ncbi:BaiN/RdsA family NAD(P)/FAD-dependent oxidoreductase [Catalinimonas niigatensis]|uniref:NAD(P)/FAD-dependent oxidoreductase n=1 Tax=Catalinimonas niigatensis TaxID=1397264 RepID=UPI0026654435|nr:NAD(P)/FAD-dependent oxidoreductase [Catalinimonas niigatensis]WPP52260.1 NAD(P)/FAD-dependent oxidoreductase [Catalinimonas niigatensis]